MIQGINLPNLRNAEFLQFATDVLGLVDEAVATTLHVGPAFTILQQETAALEALFKQGRGSSFTSSLEQMDVRRDNALTGITSCIDSYTYHFSETIRNAALALQRSVGVYGTSISRNNYQSETATIRNITNDWRDNPELTAAITVLGLDGWQHELIVANTAFADTYLARTQEMGAAPDATIREARLRVYAAYYALRDLIGAHALINNHPPEYVQITAELNALVDQYNNLLADRAAGGADEENLPPVE